MTRWTTFNERSELKDPQWVFYESLMTGCLNCQLYERHQRLLELMSVENYDAPI